MATRTTVTFICDLPHGSETGADGLVTFAYGGRAYEMHLCAAHRGELALAVNPFVNSARRAGQPAPRVPQRRRRPHTKTAIGQARERRDWIRANGWPQLGVKGQLPAAGAAAYAARSAG